MTLNDVLKLLEERSPRTIAGRAFDRGRGRGSDFAETLPNPTVSYGGLHLVSGLSTGAVTQHQVVLEQPLLMFHQRQARFDAAEASVNAEAARVAEALAARRPSVRRVRPLLAARATADSAESLTDMERVQQLVRGRAAAGDRSQYDVTRVEVETESLRAQAINAAADVDDVSGQLAVLLGFPGWSPRAVGTLDVGSVSTDVEALWVTAQQRRPSLVVLRRQQAAARGGLFLGLRERLRSFSGGAQTTRRQRTSAFVGSRSSAILRSEPGSHCEGQRTNLRRGSRSASRTGWPAPR